MKLYTRTGDEGQTGLLGGQRVSKDHTRVAAYGDVDELNAALGLSAAFASEGTLKDRLFECQRVLFSIGAVLANPQPTGEDSTIGEADVGRLERWIDEATASVEPLNNFILPGGSEPAAYLHLARTVCRRAERAVVHLAGTEPVHDALIAYLNRLSDLLFAWARLANLQCGAADVVWKPSERPPT